MPGKQRITIDLPYELYLWLRDHDESMAAIIIATLEERRRRSS